MPKEVTERCKTILAKYLKYKNNKYKITARDNLYYEMKGYLIAWINSLLKKWGKFEQQDEILSLSWLAFMFCLDNYKQEYTSLEKYLYGYTRYFLLNNYAKKENVHISLDELKDILLEFPTPENQCFERLLTLFQFRATINEKCLTIWDDAMDCLNGKTTNKYKIPDRFSRTAYYATRDSFAQIIKLIIGLKDNSSNQQEDKNKQC